MDCKIKHKSNFSTELEVNGQKVRLNRFTRDFILRTIIGMLKPLSGFDEVEVVELKITKIVTSKE